MPDWEGCYEVSNLGRVYSVKRHGSCTGRMMTPGWHPYGYPFVWLKHGDRRRKGYVHRLILAAFVGPCPEGMQVRHLDGDPANCTLGNLAYGTKSENERDKLIHGTHQWAKRTHCLKGHPYSGDNLRIAKSDGRRCCRTCYREWDRARRVRKALKAAGYVQGVAS